MTVGRPSGESLRTDNILSVFTGLVNDRPGNAARTVSPELSHRKVCKSCKDTCKRHKERTGETTTASREINVLAGKRGQNLD